MKQQLRVEIKDDGQVHVKTIGMTDDSCLDYVPLMEELLDAKAIKSEFTDEYLQAQHKIVQDTHVIEKQTLKDHRKG